LAKEVLDCLKKGWSPEQTCAWLARIHGQQVISPESIYRFIYARLAAPKTTSGATIFPRQKQTRLARSQGRQFRLHIQSRISIAERPSEVEDRSVPGHWEADLMLFARYGQAILACMNDLAAQHRLTLSQANFRRRRPQDRQGADLAAPRFRQTITFDNGTEFACHHELHRFDIQTFFCDPYAPWQKGGIENAIGRLRRFIPAKPICNLTPRQLSSLVAAYNNTPASVLTGKPSSALSKPTVALRM